MHSSDPPCRAKVLKGTVTQTTATTTAAATPLLRLSARPSHGGGFTGVTQASIASAEGAKPASGSSRKRGSASAPSAGVAPSAPELVSIEALPLGSKVHGYVKAVGPKGLFLALDRDHDARIRIRNLSDG